LHVAITLDQTAQRDLIYINPESQRMSPLLRLPTRQKFLLSKRALSQINPKPLKHG